MPVTLTVYPAEPFNSYASLAFFQAHCAQKLRVITGKTDDQLRAALIVATEYMDVRHSYVGYRKLKGQEREWPREEAYDVRGDKVEGIHIALQNACSEYAFRALSMDLMPDPSVDASGQVVKSRDEKVGPISESVTYETVHGLQLPVFPLADRLLYAAGLIVRRGGFSLGSVGRG